MDYKLYKFSSYKGLISYQEAVVERELVLKLFDGLSNFKYTLEAKKDSIEIENNVE